MRAFVAVALLMTMGACAKKAVERDTTDIAATARYAGYPMDHLGAGTIQLSGGAYHDTAAGLDVRLIATATGDLDGDDRPDAAVVLASQTGGTGTFVDLYAL